jgi:hypothetical protein
MVSPEVLRLQANRPDERQQRNRTRVVSPPIEEKVPIVPTVESKKQVKPISQGGQRQIAIPEKNESAEKDTDSQKQTYYDVALSGETISPALVNSPLPLMNGK